MDCSRLTERRTASGVQANGSRRTADTDTETLTLAVELCLQGSGSRMGGKQPGCHRLADPADVLAASGQPSGFAESLQDLDMCRVSVLAGAGSRTAARRLPFQPIDLGCRRMG